LNLEEKTNKLKEGMKMMGVSDAALWLSWFFTYAIIFLIADLMLAAALRGNIVIYTSFGTFVNEIIWYLVFF
jgi:ATP-binding cassette subfamily A (ABC1) protein 3